MKGSGAVHTNNTSMRAGASPVQLYPYPFPPPQLDPGRNKVSKVRFRRQSRILTKALKGKSVESLKAAHIKSMKILPESILLLLGKAGGASKSP